LPILDYARTGLDNSENFAREYRKKLKFQNDYDWKKYRASVDLLCDTEYAIQDCFEYQLGYLGSKTNGIGEVYLRLYGVLNAVYLQKSALETLLNMTNFPNREKLIKEFENLDIYKLRNYAGAHTLNSIYDSEILKRNPTINKIASFRIIQVYLEKTGAKISLLDHNNLTHEFCILKCLTEYETKTRHTIIALIEHIIKTLVQDKDRKKSLKSLLDNTKSNLIDYSKINKNSEFKIAEKRRLEKLLKSIKTEFKL